MLKLNRNKIKRVVCGVDWGFTHPGVVQVWAIDNDGRMYLVHEIYKVNHTIDYWIEEAKAIQAHFEPEAFVCDPAEPSFIQQFRNAGLWAEPGFNDIEAGIQAVKQRIKPAGDGKPRLYIVSGVCDHNIDGSMAGLQSEIEGYVWDRKRQTDQLKEVPVDRDNHSADPLRYVCCYVDEIEFSDVSPVSSSPVRVESPFKAIRPY